MIPIVRAIRADGVTIVMIEHVMQAVMSLADDVHVLANGRMIAQGPPAAIAEDPAVIEAYLGRGTADKLRLAAGSRMADAPLLEIAGLRGGYGPVEVLRGVDMVIDPREVVAVLGSNGAGKSTLNNTVCGLFPALPAPCASPAATSPGPARRISSRPG